MTLTKEKLEEYITMLKQGKIELDELTAGLIAIHGVTRIEGTMTPGEFLNYLQSMGLPLVMSDELRKEFEAVKKQAESP